MLNRIKNALRSLLDGNNPDDYIFRFKNIVAYQYVVSKEFCIVIIGANDGKSMDPIYDFIMHENVKGILVEPLTDLFQKLEKNYEKASNMKCINQAVHATEKKVTIYRVNPEITDAPEWAHGIGSLDPEHHKRSGIPDDYIIEESVASDHLMNILDRENIHRIDLLKIDVEGYDYEVLKMLDFNKIKPAIIRYEHTGLDKKDRKAAMSMLRNEGYSLVVETTDTIAVMENRPGWNYEE